MEVAAFLNHIKSQPFYKDQLVHVERIPPRMALHGKLDEPLPPALESALTSAHLLPLYSHQASAINLIRSGNNVIVVTPTASGKTLCYNVPVLESVLTEKGSRALYLFPTKALAQDQLRSLGQLASTLPPVRYDTFDGDTPGSDRAEVKQSARVILSNPDMLHLGILPNHQSWARFLEYLKYVVLDEAHIYRGVFGSHVADVLRRLRRLCYIYGSRPRFILCSATIANAGEHAERLTGLPFEVVNEDGSPHGGKYFSFWDPPLLDPARSTRRSANSEAATLFTELVCHGIRSLTFAKTRRLTELIYIYSRNRLAEVAPELKERIKPYRGGYLPQERRQIEKDLFQGHLMGVVATTALELGVDIGSLDATVLTGYPGSIASTWQQAGRSGRGKDASLSFLIGLNNPLDQYFMRHPEAFFSKSHEHALIDHANPHILKPHLLCAAYEMPLSHADADFFGPRFEVARHELEQEGLLHLGRRRRWYLSPQVSYPAEAVNIRSTSSANYAIVDTSRGGQLLETVDAAVAMFQVYPGAVYLHQGESYLITKLDLQAHTAYAKPAEVDYYTNTLELNDIKILEQWQQKPTASVDAYLGKVQVTTQVVGFKKKRAYTEEVVGQEPLDLPPTTFDTVALWFDIPAAAIETIIKESLDFAGGLHACEHAAIGMLPLFAMCDRNDIGGVSTPAHSDTGRPQVFIYDGHPGGIGISEKGYELIEELWEATIKAVQECPCEDGCPSCIQSPKCGNNNEPLDKKAAVVLLEKLLVRSAPSL